MSMEAHRAQECMRRAIECAARSKPEKDGRPHPQVGAVLSDPDGNVLLEMARGEFETGLHAEAGLIARAEQEGIDLKNTVLFSTLEPCTWRRSHVPCALRIRRAGIPQVYIGILDPNLRICGRGEAYLSMFSIVERFPDVLRREITAQNLSFLGSKQPELAWVVEAYGIDPAPVDRPPLSVLHLSQDLIATGDGEVWIFAGDLSWLEELQPALLRAHLDGRPVRILLNRPIPTEREEAALATGAAIARNEKPLSLRSTIVGPKTDRAQGLIVGHGDARRLEYPEDRTLIETLCEVFEERWETGRAGTPRIRELDGSFLLEALGRHVPQYANVALELREVPIEMLRPLPSSLEEFKLARWDLLSRTIKLHDLPEAFTIEGSPWLCTPPVVEVYPDGMHVIIDGAHRAFADRSRGKAKIRAIVARMPNPANLPTIPRGGWDELGRSHETLPREIRYRSYEPAAFRDIARAFRLQMEATQGQTG